MMILIDSGRLEFRLPDVDDIPMLENVWCDPTVMRFCSGPMDPERLGGIVQNIRSTFAHRGYAVLAVIRKEDNRLVGITGCKEDGPDPRNPELIYHFEQSVWGRGYATEAVQAYISWMKRNSLADAVHASVMPGNMPSINVLVKSGFVQKGFVRFEDTGFVEEPYFELELNGKGGG